MTTSSKPMIRGRLGELDRAHRRDLGLLLLRREPVERLALGAQRRVLQVALLAAGAAHQHRVHALGVVLGERRGALRRLVVGVGVDVSSVRRSAVTRSTLSAPCHGEPGHLACPPACSAGSLHRRSLDRGVVGPGHGGAGVRHGRRQGRCGHRRATSGRTCRRPRPTTTTLAAAGRRRRRCRRRRSARRRCPAAAAAPSTTALPVAAPFSLALPWAERRRHRRPLHVRRRRPLAAADLDGPARRHRRAGARSSPTTTPTATSTGRWPAIPPTAGEKGEGATITGAVEGVNDSGHHRLERPVPARRRRRTPTASRCTRSTSRPSCPTASPAPS